MKYSARNKITARVTSIQQGDVVALVKFEVMAPAEMASLVTAESVRELALQVGDEVQLLVKAGQVLVAKA